MQNMHRLKSTLLTQTNNKWYYKDKLYTGIIFFDKAEYVIEPFEVVEGEIIKPYISLCQYDKSGELIPSPIYIDSSDFCNKDSDTYGSGTIQQLYKGEKYIGICFTFINGMCNREYCTDSKGVMTDSKIDWNIETQQAKYFKLYIKNVLVYYGCCTYGPCTLGKEFHYYRLDKNGYETTGIKFNYYELNNKVYEFAVCDDFIQNKEYLNSPLPVPKFFEFFENYENLLFDEHIIIEIPNGNEKIIKELMIKGAFQDTKSIRIDEFIDCESLLIFMDKKAFPNLQELHTRHGFTREAIPEELAKVEELKASNPHFEIELN